MVPSKNLTNLLKLAHPEWVHSSSKIVTCSRRSDSRARRSVGSELNSEFFVRSLLPERLEQATKIGTL